MSFDAQMMAQPSRDHHQNSVAGAPPPALGRRRVITGTKTGKMIGEYKIDT